MGNAIESYIGRARMIGALYALVPTTLWSAGMLIAIPFRSVYLVRISLALILGATAGAFAHGYGLRLWLAKHRSADGPATAHDGVVIGSAVGAVTALFPPLTTLIASNHPEEAKTFIIVSWLAGAVLGAVAGGVLAARWGGRIARRDAK